MKNIFNLTNQIHQNNKRIEELTSFSKSIFSYKDFRDNIREIEQINKNLETQIRELDFIKSYQE